MTTPSPAIAKFLSGINSKNIVTPLGWEEWLAVAAPYGETEFSMDEVETRYHRNGYDWDSHGRLYRPTKEVNPEIAFVRHSIAHQILASVSLRGRTLTWF